MGERREESERESVCVRERERERERESAHKVCRGFNCRLGVVRRFLAQSSKTFLRRNLRDGAISQRVPDDTHFRPRLTFAAA
jgi:hypothetical protein